MLDDSDSKTGGAFIVWDSDIGSRQLDAPCVEALLIGRFKFNLRIVQAACSRPAVAWQRRCGNLRRFVVIDSQVSICQIALAGALDPNLRSESFARNNSR